MNGDNVGRKFKDDRVVNLINSNFISLKDSDMKRNNEILHPIINEVVESVKEKNEFFKDHYRNIMFVGSFYKGTKVGKPEEFDLDLIIQLPLKYESIEFSGNLPGYTKLKLNPDSYKPGWDRYTKIFGKWVTPEGYLNQQEFYQYMESIFTNLPKSVNVGDKIYELSSRKSGPAFTLCVKGSDSLEMSVDLVPVLEFRSPPPVPGDFSGGTWFAVPKTPKQKDGIRDPHLYWRMSFYGFEKPMLRQHGVLKPVIRQLKKLRDTENWKLIASYHIEMLSLHRIKAMKNNPELQKCSLMQHFVDMLGQLKEACETNRIVNIWDANHNLIEDVKPNQLASIKGRLDKIMKHIEKDPFAIAEYILTKDERASIESELSAYRNAVKSPKTDEQKPVKSSDVKLMHSKSCNVTSSSESGAVIRSLANLSLMDSKEKNETSSFIGAAKTEDPISAVNEDEISPANKTERNDSLAEMLNILKLMQSDIAETKNTVNNLVARVAAVEQKIVAETVDTKDAVKNLTRRVAAIEDKLEILVSRSYSRTGEDREAILSAVDQFDRMGDFCRAQSQLLQ